ncbi:transcriptional regulator [Bifidobacterium olomucense]|uniref:Transcriptional regulator n=1 Tax=Bifidobacterium olomucense TaxID=2675324 RepID=A0A7Y0EZQ3_9BIFI|nr:transcriptional regulator [Bifidobacterium sp. DSM 109959]NMM99342.1 transcriptional regulator [Bifidobacterium sp. DSM 109959]
MQRPQFTDWHAYDYLESEDDIRDYLQACKEYDDPRLMAAALKDAEEARKKNSFGA